MTAIYISDGRPVEITDRKRLPNGFLQVKAKLARTGVQDYGASEFPPDVLTDGLRSKKVIKVFRPADEVFKPESMASFANVPVTNDHPAERIVAAENFRKVAIGYTHHEVDRDGDFMTATLTIADEGAIKAIEAGKVQLSNGYACDLEEAEPGSDHDLVQVNIRGNHVALVKAGRCGDACRLMDGKPVLNDCACGGDKEDNMTTVKVTVDGITIDATEQAKQVIDKLQVQVDAAAKAKVEADLAVKAANDAAAAAQAKHDVELKAANDKVADLTAKLADATVNLDARIEERQKTVETASRIIGKAVDAKGKTVDAIRKEAVLAALGDAARDYSDLQVSAAFDALSAQVARSTPARSATRDPVADAVAANAGAGGGARMTREQAWTAGLQAQDKNWLGAQKS